MPYTCIPTNTFFSYRLTHIEIKKATLDWFFKNLASEDLLQPKATYSLIPHAHEQKDVRRIASLLATGSPKGLTDAPDSWRADIL